MPVASTNATRVKADKENILIVKLRVNGTTMLATRISYPMITNFKQKKKNSYPKSTNSRNLLLKN